MDQPYQLDASTKWTIVLYKNSAGDSCSTEVGTFSPCTNVVVGVASIMFLFAGKTYISSLGYLIEELK